jgi:hypothetical protein
MDKIIHTRMITFKLCLVLILYMLILTGKTIRYVVVYPDWGKEINIKGQKVVVVSKGQELKLGEAWIYYR